MSQSQILKAIGVAKYYLARLPYHAPDKAQRLANKGFTWVYLAVKYHDGKQSRHAETLQSQVLKAIGLATRYLSEFEFKTPSKAQKLTAKGFTWVRVTARFHDGKQYRYSETLALSDVSKFWNFENKNNKKDGQLS